MSLKILINNEEVVSNSNLQIKEEMLSTSSTILKNCYPKVWEEDKDYVSRYYYPKDYSKCKIYNLPRENATQEQTGTNLSFETYVGKSTIEDIKFYGDTLQNGTPTPDTPVEIQNVTGLQNIEVCGKNLFNANNNTYKDTWVTHTIDNTNKITVTNSYSWARLETTIKNLKPNTNYTISTDITNASGLNCGLWGARDLSNISTNTNFKSSITKQSDSSGNLEFYFYVNYSGTTTSTGTVTFDTIQIEENTQATTYEPYKGNTYEVNLGKNIWSVGNKNVGWATNYVDVKNILNTLSEGTYSITLNFKVTEIVKERTNNQYGFAFYNSNGIIQNRINAENINIDDVFTYTYTFTILSSQVGNFTQAYFYGFGNGRDNVTARSLMYDCQLEKGSQATSYSPYFTPIELNKISTYQDSIKKSSGKNLLNNGEVYSYTIQTGSKILFPTTDRYAYLVPVKPNTTYTFSRSAVGTASLNYIALLDSFTNGVNNHYTTVYNIGSNLTYTITTESTTNYIMVICGSGYSTNMQLELGDTATNYEPYLPKGTWYLEKNTRKLELAIKDMNNSENYPGWKNQTQLKEDYPNPSSSAFSVSTEYVNNISQYPDGGISINMSRNNATLYLTKAHFGSDYTQTYWKTNYPNLVFSMIYGIQTPEITEITNEELINQLESLNIELYEGQTNFIINGSLPMPTYIKIYTNFEELIFCGFTKNTGNVSLNPRQFHGVDLQILDFKDLLSTGETLNYVIANKTITEAINQVVNSISDYGFVVGNIEILNPNEMIGAYSTLNKTAYDVFQYFADITQSRWTTRMVDENTIAIDFYDPSLMPTGVDIDKTKIIDMSFNYSTNDYRNKQIMTSDEVYANITQTETIIADGYATSFMCQNKIGIITSITLNGEEKTFATKSEEQLGISADFVYKPGDTTFVSNNSISAGGIIVITYYPIVKGREIVLNNIESNRIENQINRNGTISRYENRNDTTSSQELQKIGQSYIKYKGKAEINLKIQSELNTWEVGQIVSYNAPLSELSTTYMVKSKEINMYLNAKKIFYTYNLTSNYNSENAINYFDNQRAKNQGNIGEGETITRNIDLESTALIKFYDTEINEIQVSNPTSLDFALDGVLI